MKKMPSLFVRKFHGPASCEALNEVTPGAEWVLAGEGVASQKLDGTCCLVRGGVLFKRYDAKHGKTPPPGFEPAQPEADPVTGHWPGWIQVGDGPADHMHREAWAYAQAEGALPDGTYELLGPKVNRNPEGAPIHMLVSHGAQWGGDMSDAPREFHALREWLAQRDIEGVVWRHPDGRMVKIKKSDFGMPRKPVAP